MSFTFHEYEFFTMYESVSKLLHEPNDDKDSERHRTPLEHNELGTIVIKAHGDDDDYTFLQIDNAYGLPIAMQNIPQKPIYNLNLE